MAWYRTGTVSITINTTTVTGVNTNFAANARVGDGFLGPDGRWYEVVNIASATVLSIQPAYLGATINNATYAIAPIQGYNKDTGDKVSAIVSQYGLTLAVLGNSGTPSGIRTQLGLGTVSTENTVPITKGGTGSTNISDARTALGLGSVSVENTVPLSKGGTGQSVANSSALIAALGAMPAGGISGSVTFNAMRLTNAANYGSGQGSYIGWNDPNDSSNFTGQMSFTSNRGGGSGGFSWRSITSDNTATGPTMTYSYDGILNVPGTVRIGGSDIVARGFTSTGEWTRFSDGTQICTLALQTNSMGTYAVGTLFGSDAVPNYAYPASFLVTPKVTASAVAVGSANPAACFVSNYGAPSQTSWGTWRALSTNNAAIAAIINLTAVGRWK